VESGEWRVERGTWNLERGNWNVVIRPLTPADSEAARSIWNDGVPRAALSDVLFDEKVWEDPDIADGMRVAAINSSGRLTGFGIGVPRGTTPQCGAIKLLAVDARDRHAGVGSAIMASLVESLRLGGCNRIRLGESPPNYLQAGVDSDDEGARLFFESLGFASFGKAHDMLCSLKPLDLDTTGDERRLAAQGIRIRRAGERSGTSELAAIDGQGDTRALSAIGELWSAWLPEVNAALALSPPAVHLAETFDGVFAGFAAHSANNRSVGWFGPMGTDPRYRGLGIGTILLRRCLRDLREAGFETATIPWVGPVEFYERSVGARTRRSYLRYELIITE